MIAVLLANGFEEIEALGTVDILRRCGEDVKTVAVAEDTNIINGGHNISVVCDINLYQDSNIISQAEVVVLPGGLVGVENLGKSKEVEKQVHGVVERGGYAAAICAAPTLLAKYGMLEDQVAVCYPGMEDELTGAYKGVEKAVISGNIITSKAAGTTEVFACKIMKALGKEDICQEIIEKMYY